MMLGFRLQWGGGNARNPRQGMMGDAAVAGSRAQRRLALQRMTQEERLVPGYGYGLATYGDDDVGEFGMFAVDDPMGRMDQGMMLDMMLEEDEEGEEGFEEEEEPLDTYMGPQPVERQVHAHRVRLRGGIFRSRGAVLRS